MKLKVTSIIAANTAISHFAPDHGKQAYRVEPNGDVTLLVIDNCDHCNCECEGANSVTIVKPRSFVFDLLVSRKFVKTEVTDESGCTEDGDVVCPECYEKSQIGKREAQAEWRDRGEAS